MSRLWNLQAKFVALIVLLLLGSFLLQTVVDHYSKERLLAEVTIVAEDLVDEASHQLMNAVVPLQAQRARPRMTFIVHGGGGQKHKLKLRQTVQLNTQALQEHVERAWNRRVEELRDVVRALQQASDRRLDAEGNSYRGVHQEELLEFATLLEQIPDSSPPARGGAPQMSPTEALERLGSPYYRNPSSPADATSIDLTPYTNRLESIFERHRRFDLLSTVGILLLGISLAWFLGVRVTRPMAEISEGFQRVAAGDLDYRVQVNEGGELAFLGEQFNRMTEGLQQNRELERELVLRERIQHMGDLAAGVAHDVRNPLNAIHLNISQIRDEFLPGDPEKQSRFLRFTSDVQSEVERLNELVTNYLSLAQPSSTDLETVDPNELIHELTRLLEKEAAGRRVELRVDLEDQLPAASWNRQELKSAFLNVAINALQSMEPEGGHLDFISSVRENGLGSELAITFIDTGCGISEDNLEKIFLPYFTTRSGGTGLGMAVARRIVERHGGRLQVRSRIGEGTAMSFLFPIEREEEGGA